MPSKRGDVRQVITVTCDTCKAHSYTTTKNRRNDPGRIQLQKYCPHCRGHQSYREKR